MPKTLFTLRDFSGGINSVQDPRDVNVNQFAYLSNFYVDQNGALRPSGSLIAHNGLVSNKSIMSVPCIIAGSGGRNLKYFEVDHDVGQGSGITGGTVQFFTGGQSPFGGGASGVPPPPSTD
jgi:hypothetical protein